MLDALWGFIIFLALSQHQLNLLYLQLFYRQWFNVAIWCDWNNVKSGRDGLWISRFVMKIDCKIGTHEFAGCILYCSIHNPNDITHFEQGYAPCHLCRWASFCTGAHSFSVANILVFPLFLYSFTPVNCESYGLYIQYEDMQISNIFIANKCNWAIASFQPCHWFCWVPVP